MLSPCHLWSRRQRKIWQLDNKRRNQYGTLQPLLPSASNYLALLRVRGLGSFGNYAESQRRRQSARTHPSSESRTDSIYGRNGILLRRSNWFYFPTSFRWAWESANFECSCPCTAQHRYSPYTIDIRIMLKYRIFGMVDEAFAVESCLTVGKLYVNNHGFARWIKVFIQSRNVSVLTLGMGLVRIDKYDPNVPGNLSLSLQIKFWTLLQSVSHI